jgi:hypothetical protein
MYEVQSQMVDLRVTLNHKMYVKQRGGDDYELIEAQNIKGRRVQYQRNAVNVWPDQATFTCWGGEDGDKDVDIPMDAWLRLVGSFIADGYIEKNTGWVMICCSKQRKIDFHVETCRLAGIPGLHYPKCRAFVIKGSQISRALRALNVGALQKTLPEYVWGLSQRQARILLDAMIEGDGHKGATATSYFTSSLRLSDDVMRLALHAGWSANKVVMHPAGTVSTSGVNGSGTPPTCNADYWSITIVKARNNPMMNHGNVNRQNGQSEAIAAYKGKVYCLTVPSHVFYVRRRGKPVWTGNSIVARKVPQSDMPFTESGLTMDILVNPHCIPSRMTIGQLIETSLAKVCARKGVITDGTAFLKVSHEEMAEQLAKHGFRYNGRERLYNGPTGEYYDAAIFVGPVYEQRYNQLSQSGENAGLVERNGSATPSNCGKLLRNLQHYPWRVIDHAEPRGNSVKLGNNQGA